MEITSTLAQDTNFYKGIAAWLETTMSAPMAHWGVIMASATGAASEGASLGIPVSAAVSSLSHGAGADVLGTLSDYLLPDLVNPNIEGIPISSPRIRSSRESDISEQQVICQKSATKEYRTDNTVPRLMEWSIEGYITSLSDINRNYRKAGKDLKSINSGTGMAFGGPDKGLPIKPTLVLQKQYLDACQCSRRPVWFKTNDCQFKLVQIASCAFDQEASNGNTVQVTMTLKEFNPYIIEDDTAGKKVAKKKEKKDIWANYFETYVE